MSGLLSTTYTRERPFDDLSWPSIRQWRAFFTSSSLSPVERNGGEGGRERNEKRKFHIPMTYPGDGPLLQNCLYNRTERVTVIMSCINSQGSSIASQTYLETEAYEICRIKMRLLATTNLSLRQFTTSSTFRSILSSDT